MRATRRTTLPLLLLQLFLALARSELTEAEKKEVEAKHQKDQFDTLLEGIGKDDEPLDSAKQRTKKVRSQAFDQDLPYIYCEVCEKMAAVAWTRIERVYTEWRESPVYAQQSRKGVPKMPHETQMKIEEIVDSVCDADAKDNDWIKRLDIQQNPKTKQLYLRRQPEPGKCRRECRTIEKACADVLEMIVENDMADDLTDKLIRMVRQDYDDLEPDPTSTGVQNAQFHVCRRMAKACRGRKTAPTFEGERTYDEPFQEVTEKDLYYRQLKAASAARRAADPKGGGHLDRSAGDEEFDDPPKDEL